MDILLLLFLFCLVIPLVVRQKSGQQALQEELQRVHKALEQVCQELRLLRAAGQVASETGQEAGHEARQEATSAPQRDAALPVAFQQSNNAAAPCPAPADKAILIAPDLAAVPCSREEVDEAIPMATMASARHAEAPIPSVAATEEPLLPEHVDSDSAWAQAELTPAPAASPAFQTEQKAVEAEAIPPSPFISALSELWSWLRLNPLLFGGLSVFLVGVAFALGYLVTHSYISPAMRLVQIGIGGAIMQALGWRLRRRNRLFGLSLIGGGSVVLYFTLFAAYRLEMLLPLMALLFMVALVLETCALALLTDAQLLAVVATAGAISAPLLIDTGSESFVALFGYYALLSAGATTLAACRRWDLPVLFACVAVYGIGGFWAAHAYQPELLTVAEGFLVLFFAILTTAHLLLAAHANAKDAALGHADHPSLARRLVHASLLCGVPLLSFSYHYWLVQDIKYAAALGALALATVDLTLFWVLRAQQGAAIKLTKEALLIMGLAFLVLAAPLALNAAWTSCTWALQGLAFFWQGVRQDRPFLRALGYAMQVLAAVAFFVHCPEATAASRRACEATLVLAACALLIFCHLGQSNRRAWEETLFAMLECWTLGFWLLAGADLLHHWWPGPARQQTYANAVLAFMATSCLLWVQIGFRLNWRIFASTIAILPLAWLGAQLLHIPELIILTGLPALLDIRHAPLAWENGGLFALPLAWAVFGLSFGHSPWPESPEKRTELITFALLSALGLLLLSQQSWLGRISALPLNAVLVVALLWFLQRPAPRIALIPDWRIQPESLCRWAGRILIPCLAAWFMHLCGRFDQIPWPHIPLLYPLDLAQLLCLTGLYLGLRQETELPEYLQTLARMGLGLAAFILANLVVARCFSALTGCAYSPEPLLGSPAFLTTLSVLWGGIALALMVLASHFYKSRLLWFSGLVLLGLTLFKLVFLDLVGQETLHRSLSFLAVGLLMLGMGYFCPLPPKDEVTDSAEND